MRTCAIFYKCKNHTDDISKSNKNNCETRLACNVPACARSPFSGAQGKQKRKGVSCICHSFGLLYYDWTAGFWRGLLIDCRPRMLTRPFPLPMFYNDHGNEDFDNTQWSMSVNVYIHWESSAQHIANNDDIFRDKKDAKKIFFFVQGRITRETLCGTKKRLVYLQARQNILTLRSVR